MTQDDKVRAARTFLSVLSKPDTAVLEGIVTSDVVWNFPGSSPISGEAHGIEQIIDRGRTIASYGIKVAIEHATFGPTGGISLMLHNTGSKKGQDLDERICAVFAFRNGQISHLDTYLSDISMAEAFFA